jgi:hypothetical protein
MSETWTEAKAREETTKEYTKMSGAIMNTLTEGHKNHHEKVFNQVLESVAFEELLLPSRPP